MTAEEVQKVLDALKKTIENFSSQLEGVATGVPKEPTTPSIITQQDQIEANENASKRNENVTPADVKFIDEMYKKFKPLFDDLKPKQPAAAAEQADLSDVLKGDESPKVTQVNIVSISDEVLKSLKSQSTQGEKKEEKSGFLSGILGALGGAAAGGGILQMLTTLPAALPGIGVALLAIVGFTAALAASVAIVVKTLKWLKDDLVEIFPAVKMFTMLFVEVAKEIIPVVAKAIGDFVATVLPPLFEGITYFAKTILPLIAEGIKLIIDSPGFKFIVSELASVIKSVAGMLGDVLKKTGDVLISLFENIKDIVKPIIDGVIESVVKIADVVDNVLVVGINAVKDIFIKLGEVAVPIAQSIKETFVEVGEITERIIMGLANSVERVFKAVPDVVGKTLDSIQNFAANVTLGKIGKIGLELGGLAAGLTALTGGDLLSSIGNFFTGSPFEKIIEFQNQLDPAKLSMISGLGPALQSLTDFNASSIEAAGKSIDYLLDRVIKVNKAVIDLFSGKESPFSKEGGVVEIINKLNESKQSTQDSIASVITNIGTTQIQLANTQIQLTTQTNRILTEIHKKMDNIAMNAMQPAPESGRPEDVDGTVPLRFTSTNSRLQMVQSGNSK